MFTDRLKITLGLTIRNDSFVIPGGNVRSCALELRPWGFEGRVSFWVAGDKRQDTLLARFGCADLVQAQVSIEATPIPPATSSVPLVVKGLVSDKAMVETELRDLRGQPILLREYTVWLRDPAALLWRQHFPLALHAEATLADAIQPHLAQGITLDNQLDDSKQQRPLICIGCGDSKASFYDFLMWYLDSLGAVFTFDYQAAKYRLASDKPAGDAPVKLRADDVARLRLVLPETRRHGARVLNSYTEAAKTVTVDQAQAVANVYQDVLLCSPVPADVDGRKTKETARLHSRQPEIELTHARFPGIACWPGTLTGVHQEFFATDFLASGKTFRVAEVSLSAQAASEAPDLERDAPSRSYRVEMVSRWESQDDGAALLPAFARPRFPILAEGKVVCTLGDKGDRTYQIGEDKQTSQAYYEVQVPLWNVKIKAPLRPQFTVGHFYAPAYRDARVLLELYFDRAEIVRFLDFGPDVQLANDTQGNQILFGKSRKSQTQLCHAYADNKPVFTLARSNASDSQLFQMEEGVVVLNVEETK